MHAHEQHRVNCVHQRQPYAHNIRPLFAHRLELVLAERVHAVCLPRVLEGVAHSRPAPSANGVVVEGVERLGDHATQCHCGCCRRHRIIHTCVSLHAWGLAVAAGSRRAMRGGICCGLDEGLLHGAPQAAATSRFCVLELGKPQFHLLVLNLQHVQLLILPLELRDCLRQLRGGALQSPATLLQLLVHRLLRQRARRGHPAVAVCVCTDSRCTFACCATGCRGRASSVVDAGSAAELHEVHAKDGARQILTRNEQSKANQSGPCQKRRRTSALSVAPGARFRVAPPPRVVQHKLVRQLHEREDEGGAYAQARHRSEPARERSVVAPRRRVCNLRKHVIGEEEPRRARRPTQQLQQRRVQRPPTPAAVVAVARARARASAGAHAPAVAPVRPVADGVWEDDAAAREIDGRFRLVAARARLARRRMRRLRLLAAVHVLEHVRKRRGEAARSLLRPGVPPHRRAAAAQRVGTRRRRVADACTGVRVTPPRVVHEFPSVLTGPRTESS